MGDLQHLARYSRGLEEPYEELEAVYLEAQGSKWDISRVISTLNP